MSFLDVIVTGKWKSRAAQYRSDQIIVGVHDSVPERAIAATIENAIQSFSGSAIRSHRRGRRWAVVSVPQGTEPAEMALAA